MNRCFWVLPAAALLAAPCFSSAEEVYSQSPTIDSAWLLGGGNQVRFADSFQLTDAATVRSVSWQGYFSSQPYPLPATFSVAILADDGSDFPGVGLSSANPVFTDFTNIVDTGVDSSSGRDIYEFSADIPEISLAAATTYWFALRIENSTDNNNSYFWANGSGERVVFQNNSGSYRESNFGGPLVFALNDEALPEPATAALLGLGSLALIRRR